MPKFFVGVERERVAYDRGLVPVEADSHEQAGALVIALTCTEISQRLTDLEQVVEDAGEGGCWYTTEVSQVAEQEGK